MFSHSPVKDSIISPDTRSTYLVKASENGLFNVVDVETGSH